jgi:hypothetical protein
MSAIADDAVLEQHVADLRIAAATLLANTASRRGNEDAWLSRTPLLVATLAATQDATVGVRVAAAECVAHLCRNTVRMRAALKQQGAVTIIAKARAQSAALLIRLRHATSAAAGLTTLGQSDAQAAEALELVERGEAALAYAAGVLESTKEKDGAGGNSAATFVASRVREVVIWLM